MVWYRTIGQSGTQAHMISDSRGPTRHVAPPRATDISPDFPVDSRSMDSSRPAAIDSVAASEWHREVVAAGTRRASGRTSQVLSRLPTSSCTYISLSHATRPPVVSRGHGRGCYKRVVSGGDTSWAAGIAQISCPGYKTGKRASYSREWRGHTTTNEVPSAPQSARRVWAGI